MASILFLSLFCFALFPFFFFVFSLLFFLNKRKPSKKSNMWGPREDLGMGNKEGEENNKGLESWRDQG